MGYINFLPACIMGPPIEYKYYKDFMKGKDVFDKIPLLENFKVIGISLLETVFFLAMYLFQDTYMPLSDFRTDSFY